MIRASVVVFLILLLSGCSKPLPEDKQAYVGFWSSPEMRLLIVSDGTVDYERIKNGGTTTINAPLKAFEGDDFIVGIGFFDTRFFVSQTPQLIDGKWVMTVDGVTLTKQE